MKHNIFFRKLNKENMLLHVIITCIFVVGVIGALVLTGHHADRFSFHPVKFFEAHKLLLLYILVMNIITFVLFAVDKRKAVKGKQRIRIVTLLSFSFIGGSVGGMLAMKLFRHKTQTKHFTIGLPFMLVTQIAVLFYLMNYR